LIHTARRMRLDLVRLSKLDVDTSAISHTARLAGREVLVCISNALEEFQLEFVLFSVGIRVTAAPEVFDKLFALFVCVKFGPGVTFGLRDDQIDVIDPFDISLLEFALDLTWLFVRTGLCLLSWD